MEKLLTIIITCFNNENTILSAIESACVDFHNIEVLVVNDGSTDKSLSLISSSNCNSRIQLISQPNLGSASARNLGLSKVRSEWVMFLDGDDVLISSQLLHSLKVLKSLNGDVAALRYGYSRKSQPNLDTARSKSLVLDNMSLMAEAGFWRYIYRLDYLKKNKILFFPTFSEAQGFFVLDDYFFLLHFLSLNPNIRFVPKILYSYSDYYEDENKARAYKNQLKLQAIGIKTFIDLMKKDFGINRDFACRVLYSRVERSMNLLRSELPLSKAFVWSYLAIKLCSYQAQPNLLKFVAPIVWVFKYRR